MAEKNILEDKPAEISLSETLKAMSRIEGLDLKLALNRLGGKQRILELAIEQTANSINEKLGKMDFCLSKADFYGFSIEAHGLKNALAGIGAMGLSELASNLENVSKNEDSSVCERGFDEFFGLMESFAEELKANLPKSNIIEKPAGDKKFLLQTAKKTADLLNDFESDDALICISRLNEFTFGEETDKLIGYITARIKAYKYDEAVLIIKNILINDK